MYWQEWFTARCKVQASPIDARAELGWPSVDATDWPAVREHFLAGLELLRATVAAHHPSALVVPQIESPMLSTYSYRDIGEHAALHNAHHLGQVVVLRQLLTTWPPSTGSYTW